MKGSLGIGLVLKVLLSCAHVISLPSCVISSGPSWCGNKSILLSVSNTRYVHFLPPSPPLIGHSTACPLSFSFDCTSFGALLGCPDPMPCSTRPVRSHEAKSWLLRELYDRESNDRPIARHCYHIHIILDK